MKSKAILLGLGLLSSTAFADGFNTQVGLEYLDADGLDVWGVQGSYFFETVDSNKGPWAEAAFLGRNSNLSLGYIDFDGSIDAVVLGAELFGDKNSNFYGALSYVDYDSDFGVSGDVISGELGYFFDDNWLVAVGTSDEDDAPITLRTKYLSNLGGGQFFNLEAAIDDESKDLSVSGDYYFTPQTSVGLQLSQAEGFDYGVKFEHFLTRNVGFNVTYTATDDENITGVGLTARF